MVSDPIYFLQDHLGSNVATLSEAGAVVSRSRYTVWGERILTTGANTEDSSARGYTGHEHLGGFGFIHMNGRLYDPVWGRFLQADPIIQEPFNLQNYARYSYVMNNPMAFTDPTGYSRWNRIRDRVVKPIAIMVIAYYTGQWASSAFLNGATASAEAAMVAAGGGDVVSKIYVAQSSIGSSGVTYGAAANAIGGSAGGFAAGGLQGGNLNSALSSAVAGGISGGISGYFGSRYPLERVAANAVAGGVSSKIHGGTFESGLKLGLTTSLLTYANVQMRATQIASSLLDPNGKNDGTGLSGGLNRDGFKLAGGRFDFLRAAAESILGGRQNGQGRVLGFEYSSGGFVDMVLESFAGPHDAANAPWWYDSRGNIKPFADSQSILLDVTTNYTTSLLFAAPFAIAAIREQTYFSAYANGRR